MTPLDSAAAPAPPFPYSGPAALCAPVTAALARVVDPEVALNIVDIGLVYGVTVTPDKIHVLLTMTSPACPVADVIVEDIEAQLDQVVPKEMLIDVELVWEPPWSPACMTEHARRFMNG